NFVVSEDLFPVEGSNCPDRGLLLIDELPQADANAQKILANVMHARVIHGKRIKKGWGIVATGNRVADRAGANRILTQLKNRLTVVAFDACVEDWELWALDNKVKPEVIAFIRFRPELLNNFDPQSEVNATPRSWVEGVSMRLGIVDSENEFEMFQ